MTLTYLRLKNHLLEDGEDSALPETVTAVHQFVSPPLEPALTPHLPGRRPVEQGVEVTQPLLVHQHQGGEAAEAVASMSLHPGAATEASLVSLTSQQPLVRVPEQILTVHIEQPGVKDTYRGYRNCMWHTIKVSD